MKLYVGNLAFSVTSDTLKKAFEKFGNIEDASIISDKFSNRSKGFGFVTFSDVEAAKKALAEMDGKELEGRPLKVSEAKPREESDSRPQRRSFNQGYGNRSGGSNRSGSRDGNRRRY